MRIGNIKFVLFNFLPYEYKALEQYLEDMSLNGWKLYGMAGMILKFKRIEPKRINYSVDIMDKVSFFDGRNSEKTLEYREYCKKAGWEFVCEREKIQVYCSENEIDSIPIHTDENEKFDCIFKASLKYVLLNLITCIMILYIQYSVTIGGHDARFLASDLNLCALAIAIIFSIHWSIGLINFIIWIVKSKKSLKIGEAVSYNYFKGIKIKRIIYKLMLFPVILMLLSMVTTGEKLGFKILILNLFMMGLIGIVMKFVSKTKYKDKDKRMINIISYVVIIMISITMMNGLIFSEVLLGNKKNDIKSDEYILELKDFNEEAIDEDSLYTNNDNGILASRVYYSNEGENVNLSYELFESKYEWAVKYAFNTKISFLEEINVKYNEKETDFPNNIKVYINENIGEYFIVSPNKFIEIIDYNDSLDESELLNKVYEKVFMDK